MMNDESIIDSVSVFIGENEITKEEAIKDPSKRFFYLLQTFFKITRMMSKYNDVMIRLYFHAVMGAYLKEYIINKGGGFTDMRVPLIWVQNSGTGKSQLNKAANDVCQRLGLKTAVLTEFTTPGLIGTFDKTKHENNVKNGLRPGMEITKTGKNGEDKTIKYIQPIIYGDVYYHDILFFDEAKILFQKSKYTENVLSVLQPAMDFPGKVRKKMAAEEAIEYDCSCTLVMSTVEWSTVGMDVMSQGFFPRCLFYSKEVSINEYIKMQAEVHRNAFDENEYRKHLNDFAYMIEKHDIPIPRDKHKIYVDNACMHIVQELVLNWYNKLSDKLYGDEANVIKAFASRLHIFLYKLAGQMAIMNNKVNPLVKNEVVYVVGETELEYAKGVVNEIYNYLLESISVEDTVESSKLYSTSIRLMQTMFKAEVQTYTKKQVIDFLMVNRGVGKHKAERLYHSMLSANFISEGLNELGDKIVTPNWKLWINMGMTKEKIDKNRGDKNDKNDMQKTQIRDNWTEMSNGFEM